MSFLEQNRTVAKPGFNRWMVPPAALCVHLCIGQAYAFSVFNLPMTKLLGVTQSAPDDWNLPELGWIFSIAIFVLGFSAAIFGRWVEEGGPRRAMFTAALCWAGGFLVAAFGVARCDRAVSNSGRRRFHLDHRFEPVEAAGTIAHDVDHDFVPRGRRPDAGGNLLGADRQRACVNRYV